VRAAEPRPGCVRSSDGHPADAGQATGLAVTRLRQTLVQIHTRSASSTPRPDPRNAERVPHGYYSRGVTSSNCARPGPSRGHFMANAHS
jgi:hypothetical protein